tara:strand:- start:386 stop:1117 length:732 start_codon:yes stop_codon:yes gene_type:complete
VTGITEAKTTCKRGALHLAILALMTPGLANAAWTSPTGERCDDDTGPEQALVLAAAPDYRGGPLLADADVPLTEEERAFLFGEDGVDPGNRRGVEPPGGWDDSAQAAPGASAASDTSPTPTEDTAEKGAAIAANSDSIPVSSGEALPATAPPEPAPVEEDCLMIHAGQSIADAFDSWEKGDWQVIWEYSHDVYAEVDNCVRGPFEMAVKYVVRALREGGGVPVKVTTHADPNFARRVMRVTGI